MTTQPVVTLPGERRKKAKPAKPPRTRRRTWKQFGLALSGLAYLAAVAFGTMLLGGGVVHHLVPTRHVDMFAALHNHIVLGVLLGLSVLWLMPPYPWAQQEPSTESQDPAQSAGEAEGGGATSVTDLWEYRAGPRLAGPGGAPMA